MKHFCLVAGQINAKTNILLKIRNIVSKRAQFLYKFISTIAPF